MKGGSLSHPTEKISSVDIFNTLATGAQDMESISKDKSYSTFQESSTGWHVELYQHLRFKNSFHFGTFSQHLGIIKVNHFLFKKLKKNSLWNNHKENN